MPRFLAKSSPRLLRVLCVSAVSPKNRKARDPFDGDRLKAELQTGNILTPLICIDFKPIGAVVRPPCIIGQSAVRQL